jgi:hypothetical protein
MNPPTTISHRVNVSMVTLKWSDVLSMLLPGVVALYAIAPAFPSLQARLVNLDGAGTVTGLMLLIAAALAGGVLEAITRIAWEPLWLVRRCKPPDALSNLEADNLDLYERGVQSSYKYVTFYANFAWATILLLIRYLLDPQKRCALATIILILTIGILLRASYVQWTYYVNYLNKIFARRKISC